MNNIGIILWLKCSYVAIATIDNEGNAFLVAIQRKNSINEDHIATYIATNFKHHLNIFQFNDVSIIYRHIVMSWEL